MARNADLEAPGGPRRILVVEDDPLVASTFETFLGAEGYEVEIVAAGEDALAKLRGRHYHLIIVDMSLPRMTGLDLSRAIRQELPGQPIILTSGSPETFRECSPGSPHISLCLSKPFVAQELKDAVARGFASI